MKRQIIAVFVAVGAMVLSAKDDTARLQALLDSGAGRVTFPDGTFVVTKPLRIGSDTHLVCSPRTVVRLADGANCPVLANRSSEKGEDRNITVEGGVWDGNNVHQKRGPYRAPKTPGGGDINQLLVFAGVRNLHLKGLTLKDPDSYCAELTDVNGFLVEDIVFDCNDKTPNQDGIHVDGFARDGLIRNLRGHTNDDLVALNSDEGNWRSPSNDIINVTIDGLYGGDDGYTAVRLLSRNAHVENIVIRNVYGRFKYNGVSFTHWAGEDHKPGMGHFDNIVIENMFASNCMKKGGYWGIILFQEGVESVGHVTVRNLRRVDAPDCLNDNYTVRIGEGVKIDTLILDNVEQSLPDDKPLIRRERGVEIRNLIRRDGAAERPWMDRSKTPEERARLLTAALTLEEKADQLSIHFVNEPELAAFYTNRLAQGRNFGAIMWTDNARQARELQETALRTTRFGIPYLFEMDVTHGFATGFPVALGTATSWDEDLVERCETVAGREAAAAGFHLTYAPMSDISDDPRWGRICETRGEDVYLSAKINAARVRGFQKSVTACPKHFVAYSALRAGRDYHAGDCSLRELEETHLAPYREMMRFGLDAVMCAYTPFDGLDLTENDYLCREVLRNRLGFRGQLMTDWQTIRSMERYGISTNAVESACRAMNAGIDVDMRADIYADALPGLVRSGRVAESRLDEACVRVLTLKFKRGLFDDPFAVGCDTAAERAELRKPANLAVAREAVRKGVVLLENKGGVLPVPTDVAIAVTGPLADSADDLCGDWPTSYPDKSGVTPLAGFREAWGAKLVSVDRAGTVLYCCGERRTWGGEHHSRLNPVVPAEQVAEMRALKAKGKKVVAIVLSARPLVLTDVRETADAILFAFFPGIEGGHGLADLVSGAANPSGRLVNTFPHAVGQIPLSYRERRAWSYDEWVDGATAPLYPFGYGLSYTTFAYGKPFVKDGAVQVEVTNTGSRDGQETVQFYLRKTLSRLVSRERELKGFRKVSLKAGESRVVSFPLEAETFRTFTADHRWADEPCEAMLYVGGDASTTNGVRYVYRAGCW